MNGIKNFLFIEKYRASVKRSIAVAGLFGKNRDPGVDMAGYTC